MRQIQLLFSIILMAAISLTSIQAQSLDISWGEDIDLENKVLKVIGENEEGHYALTYKKKEFFLEYFKGEQSKQAFSTPLQFKKENGIESELADIFYLQGNLLLFTVTFDKQAKSINIYGYMLDERGKINSERLDVLNIPVEKKKRSGEFGFKITQDGDKLLVFHAAPHKKQEKAWHINAKIVTSDMIVLKEIAEVIPLEEDKDEIEISNYFIENSGAVYIAARRLTWEKNMEITKDLTIYQYEPSNGFELVKIPVDLKDKSASSIALASDIHGNLIGAGFYSERVKAGISRYAGLAGTYYVKINRIDAQVEVSNLSPFGSGFAATLIKAKKADKGKLVPNVFIPREIIAREDGGAILLSEFYTSIYSQSGPSAVTSITHGPIVVANINPDGKVDWVKSIAKRQIYNKKEVAVGATLAAFTGGLSLAIGFSFWINVSKDQTVYHSYMTGVDKDKLYILYNDIPKNIALENFRDTAPLMGYKKSVPVVVEIDGYGNMNKTLLEGGKSEVVIRPGISFQSDYGEAIIYGTRKKMEKFGKITF